MPDEFPKELEAARTLVLEPQKHCSLLTVLHDRSDSFGTGTALVVSLRNPGIGETP